MLRARADLPNSADIDPILAARRVVIISPHLDDAVMSLGGTIAAAARAGVKVEVLTVFGYVPLSETPAGPWDSKSGFGTEGDAAESRRREDDEACRILGAKPRWLNFGAEPYERRGSPAEIVAAVTAAVAGADCALIPGYPLAHADHAELSRLLLQAHLPCRVGLYAEQPYVFYTRKSLQPEMRAAALEPLLQGKAPLQWKRRPMTHTARRLKLMAVRSYRSQLWQLGLAHIGVFHMLWHERKQGGEAIAWVNVR